VYDNILAGIALKEFFSGDIVSLARRFEIPKDALRPLLEISDQAERFDALVKILAQFGISEELVARQAGTAAVSFVKLTGSMTDLKTSAGGLLAILLKPFAEQWTKGIKQTTEGLENLKLLFDQTSKVAELNQNIFAKTEGFDAYSAKVQQINNDLPPYIQKVEALTPAQYAFAQSLITTGLNAEQAFNKTQQFGPLLENINKLYLENGFSANAAAQAQEQLAGAQLRAANSSAIGAVFVENATRAYAEHRITQDQLVVSLGQFADAQEREAQVSANSAEAIAKKNKALNENAIEALKTSQATDELKQREEGLMAVIQALVNGTITQAQAEGILANRYGVTAQQIPGLIQLTYGLVAARGALIAAENELAAAQNKPATAGQLRAAGSLGAYGDQIQRSIDLNKDAAIQEKKHKDAQLALAAARKDDALQIKLLQQEQSKFNKSSADYINLQARIESIQSAAAKSRSSGGGAPKLTPNEKINVKLLDDLDKYNNKFEDAEIKHYDKLAQIYDDFAQKQAEQFRQNEVSKRRSRADFYAGLQDAPPGVDTNKFAAAYEEAFQKAQEIAQSGKAKLAAEFLDLRTKQIEEIKKLDEDAAKIKEQQKTKKIDRKDAQSQLAYLEGRRKLIEDAQNEEQKLLLDKGDENVNQLQEQLNAENKAYEDQTGKIVTQAERAADAKIAHAERSKIAVDAENKSLADQESIYARIAEKNGGVVPKIARPEVQGNNIPTSADTSATKPIDVQATNPIPVSTQEGLLVRQVEPFVVTDVSLSTALGDLGVRLETRLGQVTEAVNNANQTISNAVRSVESAVGRIRLSAPSVVTG